MNLAGKIRVIIFFVILIILAYFSVRFTCDIYNIDITNLVIDTNDTDKVYVDGSDFTPIYSLIGMGANFFFAALSYVLYTVFVLLVSLLLVLLLRFIGIRKGTQISEQEQKISKWMFMGITFTSVIIGLILTRGTLIIHLLIYTLIWVAVVWLIYIRRICRGSEPKGANT